MVRRISSTPLLDKVQAAVRVAVGGRDGTSEVVLNGRRDSRVDVGGDLFSLVVGGRRVGVALLIGQLYSLGFGSVTRLDDVAVR